MAHYPNTMPGCAASREMIASLHAQMLGRFVDNSDRCHTMLASAAMADRELNRQMWAICLKSMAVPNG